MKIKKLTLNNFKKFISKARPIEFSFIDPETGKINPITLITGNNGEGKSSILQAISLLIGSASIDKFKPSDLDWPGFNYKYIQHGIDPVRITADITFTEDEVIATRAFCSEIQKIYPERQYKMPPPSLSSVTLYFDAQEEKVWATKESGTNAFFLTKGYQYAKQLTSIDKTYGQRFDRVGSIFWYDEHRTSSSITQYLYETNFNNDKDGNPQTAIKELIARWYYTHLDISIGKYDLRPGQFDKFSKLKKLYETIFTGRSLIRATLNQGGGNGIDIIFNDGKYDYDFTEMSAGERAIFPLLLDFANLNINNSIILIDEIELHLHPPLQQQFLNSLPELGVNNQFIITTHSPIIASQFSQDQKITVGNV